MSDDRPPNDSASPHLPGKDTGQPQPESGPSPDADPSRDPAAGDAVKDDMLEAFNAGG